jgi:hypothetical protein
MRLPPPPQPAIWIERHNYEAIKSLCVDDANLPNTYDEWLKIATEQITKVETQGIPVYKMAINPQEFSAYCRASGINTNYTTLGAFAVVLYSKKQRRTIY